MLAIVLDEPNRFCMAHVPLPGAKPDEALIKVTSAGISASDLATIHGHSPIAAYPEWSAAAPTRLATKDARITARRSKCSASDWPVVALPSFFSAKVQQPVGGDVGN